MGPYYQSLAYVSLEKKSLVTEQYGEEYTELTTESLRREMLELTSSATDSRRQRYRMSEARTPFSAMRSMKTSSIFRKIEKR